MVDFAKALQKLREKKTTVSLPPPISFLSQEEVNLLSEGTEVIVTWTGGNGPHLYTVWVDHDGNRLAGTTSNALLSEPLIAARHRVLDFVGKEYFHTRVSLYVKDRQ